MFQIYYNIMQYILKHTHLKTFSRAFITAKWTGATGGERLVNPKPHEVAEQEEEDLQEVYDSAPCKINNKQNVEEIKTSVFDDTYWSDQLASGEKYGDRED